VVAAKLWALHGRQVLEDDKWRAEKDRQSPDLRLSYRRSRFDGGVLEYPSVYGIPDLVCLAQAVAKDDQDQQESFVGD